MKIDTSQTFKSKNVILPILMAIVFSSLLLPSIYAYDPHRINTDYYLVVSSNNATTCNLSYIQYPDKTIYIFNLEMTKNLNDFYININSTNYTQLGIICHGITCTDGSQIETGSDCKEITINGTKPDSAGSLIYVVVVMISFILFLAGLVWCFNTNIKYLKLGLALGCYILLTWILFILWQLSYNYLNLQGLTDILRLFFIVTTIGIFPAFILSFVIVLKEIKDGIWEKKLLQRGLTLDDK